MWRHRRSGKLELALELELELALLARNMTKRMNKFNLNRVREMINAYVMHLQSSILLSTQLFPFSPRAPRVGRKLKVVKIGGGQINC